MSIFWEYLYEGNANLLKNFLKIKLIFFYTFIYSYLLILLKYNIKFNKNIFLIYLFSFYAFFIYSFIFFYLLSIFHLFVRYILFFQFALRELQRVLCFCDSNLDCYSYSKNNLYFIDWNFSHFLLCSRKIFFYIVHCREKNVYLCNQMNSFVT